MKSQTIEMFMNVIDNAPEWICCLDKSGQLIYGNKVFCERTGYLCNELIGIKMDRFLPSFSYYGWQNIWVELKRLSRLTLGCYFQTKHGKNIPVEISGNYCSLQDKEFMVAFVRDISKSKDSTISVSHQQLPSVLSAEKCSNAKIAETSVSQQAEKDLALLSEKYRFFFDSIRDGVVVVRSKGLNSDELPSEIIDVNDTLCKKLGYSKNELLGQSIKLLHPPGEYAELSKHLLTKIHERATIFECTHVTKSGVQIPVEVNSQNRVFDGIVTGFAVVRDITYRKKTEAKLKYLYKKEHGLRQKIEKQMEERLDFTRALTHELKTPLTPLLAATDILMDELSSKKLSLAAKQIKNSGEELLKRVNELLDCAKVEVGIFDIGEPDSQDVVPLLNDISYFVSHDAKRRNINFSSTIPTVLPVVSIDKTRIQQVILNLVDNAFKFTPGGGQVRLSAKRTSKYVNVYVEDNGIGMTAAEKANIFKPYARLSEKQSGLGLGLFLCKTIINKHNGKISIRSQKNKGTCAMISLPISGDSVESSNN